MKVSTGASLPVSGRSGARWLQKLPFFQFSVWLRETRQRLGAVAALQRLSDRELEDIGIPREDIQRVLASAAKKRRAA
ncbi:DUF1127 domain-containing protein [Acidisoma silvae]|uniref:DUF1127 domain-containing protein n=1 Tax=Acidisoma silvae TaxID=2802396 RepID=A0A963YTW3_9PROT|nr:DUF1127 domain-containing protein [Acidisoma silvae]MCB8876919.1 DUF1127 domain-containing protein [Acidisoma silvae]